MKDLIQRLNSSDRETRNKAIGLVKNEREAIPLLVEVICRYLSNIDFYRNNESCRTIDGGAWSYNTSHEIFKRLGDTEKSAGLSAWTLGNFEYDPSSAEYRRVVDCLAALLKITTNLTGTDYYGKFSQRGRVVDSSKILRYHVAAGAPLSLAKINTDETFEILHKYFMTSENGDTCDVSFHYDLEEPHQLFIQKLVDVPGHRSRELLEGIVEAGIQYWRGRCEPGTMVLAAKKALDILKQRKQV